MISGVPRRNPRVYTVEKKLPLTERQRQLLNRIAADAGCTATAWLRRQIELAGMNGRKGAVE